MDELIIKRGLIVISEIDQITISNFTFAVPLQEARVAALEHGIRVLQKELSSIRAADSSVPMQGRFGSGWVS